VAGGGLGRLDYDFFHHRVEGAALGAFAHHAQRHPAALLAHKLSFGLGHKVFSSLNSRAASE
jgi:hypothetical protein